MPLVVIDSLLAYASVGFSRRSLLQGLMGWLAG
jgi:hypothetical protein